MSRGKTWDTLYGRILADVLANGSDVPAGRSLSVGSARATKELLNYSFQLSNPRDRLLFNPVCSFNLPAAIGRFAWIMSGSDRLSDVEYYDSKARRFSDDGLTIPGSCDGARLLNPRPGFNQLERIIRLLAAEPGGRRGVATIYHPEDAGRSSRDIPCHIALAYNVRDGGLQATTIMRSSNALKVLPYDLFLMSLLAEVVACTLGVELHGYYQFAVSIHVYLDDVPQAEAASAQFSQVGVAMPAMPKGDALDNIARLLEVEREVRRLHVLPDDTWIDSATQRIGDTLVPYWQEFAHLLLIHALRSSPLDASRKDYLMSSIMESVSEPFALYLTR